MAQSNPVRRADSLFEGTQFDVTRQPMVSRKSCPVSGLVFVGLIFASSLSFAQSDKPECQCRAPGGVMRDLGTIECVDIVGKRHLVVCDMSTNTPYWRKLEQSEGCPSA